MLNCLKALKINILFHCYEFFQRDKKFSHKRLKINEVKFNFKNKHLINSSTYELNLHTFSTTKSVSNLFVQLIIILLNSALPETNTIYIQQTLKEKTRKRKHNI